MLSKWPSKNGDSNSPRASSEFALALLVAGTFFMENLDATVITPAIPKIAHSFGVQPVDLHSGVSAYLLTLGVFIPISGWVTERFGAKNVFATAIFIFTLASALCGAAETSTQFILTRILQGIGGAMMVPVGRLTVLRVTPKEKLIKAIATLTWPALIAPVLGPPLGGFIADHTSWRWIFYLNIPLGMIAFAVALRLVPNEANRDERPFDWLGFFCVGGGLFCLLFAAEMLARTPVEVLELSLSVALGIGLLIGGVIHLRRTPHPIINLGVVRIPTFLVALRGGSVFRMGVSAVPFLLPLMFQIGFGYTSFHAGLMLMAVFAGNLTMKPFTTPIMRRFGVRKVLLVNGLLNAVSIAAIATFTRGTSLLLLCAILFVGGVTRSLQFTTFNSIAFADVPHNRMSAANTLFSSAFQLAMGAGVAAAAIAWRLGEVLQKSFSSDPATPFQIAFLFLSCFSLLSLLDSSRLRASAASHIITAAK